MEMEYACTAGDVHHNAKMIQGVVAAIDEALGKGYATKNPALIGSVLTFSGQRAMRHVMSDIKDKLDALAEATYMIAHDGPVASALREISNSIGRIGD